MGEKNTFKTIGEAKEEAMAKSKKRLETAIEIEKFLDQLGEASDPDIREEIEGQIRRLLEQGRRILEREDVDDYYRRLDDLEKRVA